MKPESKPFAELRNYRRVLEPYRTSTDIGNVLQVVPAIQPCIGLNTFPATNHQPEFARHCVGPDADQAVRDASVPLAQTIVDYARIGRVQR